MASNETRTRIITGLVLAVLAIVWLFFVPEPVFLGVSLTLLLLCLSEYRQIIAGSGVQIRSIMLFGSALFGFVALYCYSQGMWQEGHLSSLFAVVNPVAYSLIRTADKKRQALILLSPLAWFVLPLFTLFLLRTVPPMPVGPKLIVWMVMVVAFNDIFAYFGGRKYGKTPLAPKISPKKTREGSLFGLLGGIAVGYLTQPYLFGFALAWEIPLIALVIIPVSQIGDLVESVFKRKYGVKDSGRILPGHGGILDRFDAILFALPVFGLLLYLLGIHQRW